jgi:hypothetical protein
MKKIFVEIEINKVITAKSLQVPINLINDSVKRNMFIRNYFTELGYLVGQNIRVC